MQVFAIGFPNIDPVIVSIPIGSFDLALRWYSLAYIVGILIGWWLAARAISKPSLWRAEKSPMTKAQLDDFVTWIIVGVIVGGRLGAVILYDPARYLAAPIDILKVWEGGMAFHGGFLGVAIALVWFQRRHGLTFWPMSDMLALTAAPGLLLGRLANFINAELWGRPTDLPWGVVFPGHAAQTCAEAVAGTCARHPSQIYEALLEGLILGIVVLWVAFRGQGLKRPGFVTGVFLAGYGLARFVVEFWREPDPFFLSSGESIIYFVEFGAGYGIAMAQILSLPMILLGLFLIFRAPLANDA